MPDFDLNAIMAANKARHQDAAVAVRAELLKQLRAGAIVHVMAEYDGQEDSGQIERPAFFQAGEESILLPEVVTEATRDMFYNFLEAEYPGWEINEGSSGEFSWTMEDDKMHLTHNMRIESVETYEEDL
jgi:hypothetical protein